MKARRSSRDFLRLFGVVLIALILGGETPRAFAGGQNPYLQTEVDFNQGGRARRVSPPRIKAPKATTRKTQAPVVMSPRARARALERQREERAQKWKLRPSKQEALCESGSPSGCMLLGAREWDMGHFDRAHALFQVACAKNEVLACSRLGKIELNRGRRQEAAEAFSAACELGSEPSCQMGRSLPAPRQPASDEEALPELEGPHIPRAGGARYESFCKGPVDECEALGDRAYAAQDLEKGFTLLDGACDRGSVTACRKLADIFHSKDDRYRVSESLKKACALGDARSCAEANALEPGYRPPAD